MTFEVVYGHAFKPAPRLNVQAETTVSLEQMRAVLQTQSNGFQGWHIGNYPGVAVWFFEADQQDVSTTMLGIRGTGIPPAVSSWFGNGRVLSGKPHDEFGFSLCDGTRAARSVVFAAQLFRYALATDLALCITVRGVSGNRNVFLVQGRYVGGPFCNARIARSWGLRLWCMPGMLLTASTSPCGMASWWWSWKVRASWSAPNFRGNG